MNLEIYKREGNPLTVELIEYCDDVISGEIVACTKHKWACERFLRDLSRQGDTDFPYKFDEIKANRYLNWMRQFKHRKGILRGQHIDPHIIQKFIFGNIYGWINIYTGYRRFSRAYWQVGRKNAKSQSLGCTGSYELAPLGEGASEVYCAATKTEQAKIVWDETDSMLKGCPDLAGKFRTAYGKIFHDKSGSFMRALSKEDKKSGDGLNPQCGIIDEYHAHETSEMYDIIDSGMVARPQPLLMIITTAGFDLSAPCYRVEYHLVSKIIDPFVSFEMDSYFVMINELDKGDDIKDERNWEKANPILCSYPEGRESIRKRLKLALEAPDKMRDFLTKSMNVWIQMRENGYMNMEKWSKCKADISLSEYESHECVVGVDMAAKIDLASVDFEFDVNGEYHFFSQSFMPEETYYQKIKTDKVPYDLWVEQGWLILTPGEVVDQEYIENYIIEKEESCGFRIREICCDPWNTAQFSNNMMKRGYEVVEIRQGIRTLGAPTKHFREMVYSGKVKHDGNPLLNWAMSNAVTRADANENIMLDKQKSTERIDPVAAIMCSHTRAMVIEESKIDFDSKILSEDWSL